MILLLYTYCVKLTKTDPYIKFFLIIGPYKGGLLFVF